MAKANSDFHELNNAFNQHKERVDGGLNKKLDKSDFYWVISGIVSVFLILATVIYNLSYSELISDNKDQKIKNNSMDKRVDRIEYKIKLDTLK